MDNAPSYEMAWEFRRLLHGYLQEMFGAPQRSRARAVFDLHWYAPNLCRNLADGRHRYVEMFFQIEEEHSTYIFDLCSAVEGLADAIIECGQIMFSEETLRSFLIRSNILGRALVSRRWEKPRAMLMPNHEIVAVALCANIADAWYKHPTFEVITDSLKHHKSLCSVRLR